MSNEIKKQISDEELKDHMVNNAFNNTSLLDILQGLTQGVLTRFALDLATNNVNRSWENHKLVDFSATDAPVQGIEEWWVYGRVCMFVCG